MHNSIKAKLLILQGIGGSGKNKCRIIPYITFYISISQFDENRRENERYRSVCGGALGWHSGRDSFDRRANLNSAHTKKPLSFDKGFVVLAERWAGIPDGTQRALQVGAGLPDAPKRPKGFRER